MFLSSEGILMVTMGVKGVPLGNILLKWLRISPSAYH